MKLAQNFTDLTDNLNQIINLKTSGKHTARTSVQFCSVYTHSSCDDEQITHIPFKTK